MVQSSFAFVPGGQFVLDGFVGLALQHLESLDDTAQQASDGAGVGLDQTAFEFVGGRLDLVEFTFECLLGDAEFFVHDLVGHL